MKVKKRKLCMSKVKMEDFHYNLIFEMYHLNGSYCLVILIVCSFHK